MLSIEEALQFVIADAQPMPSESVATSDSLGRVLAASVTADLDSPPHDKALVDGFAVRLADITSAQSAPGLPILEQVTAGEVPSQPLAPSATVQVMTGAPVPRGAQAIVMVEDTRVDDDHMLYLGEAVREEQGIMRRATTFAAGSVVLPSGQLIRPIEVGLLCEVGQEQVACVRVPQVAILPTGEELVPVSQRPGAGQIRNSNGPMLAALATRAGAEVQQLPVARDDEIELRNRIEQGLKADILVLSGGVSAGVRDLVPPTLESLRVKKRFHKIALKPGKPIWFGVHEQRGHRTLVFGLPGNPVSSLACFQLFVRTAIHGLMHRPAKIPWLPIRLESDFSTKGRRPTLWPAALRREAGRLLAKPLNWHGSGDMLTVTQADCFVYFPSCPKPYQAGAKLQAIEL